MGKKKLSKGSGSAHIALQTEPKQKHRETTKSFIAAGSVQKKRRKADNEIDDLFAAVRNQKATAAEGMEKKESLRPAANSVAVKGSKDDIFGEGTRKERRRTEEGFAIYTEDELGLDKGGDTELCPFDCKCCY